MIQIIYFKIIKLVLIISLLWLTFSNAQPIPACAKNLASTRLFLYSSDQQLLCDLVRYGAIPSRVSGCFVIHPYQMKDRQNTICFKVNVYNNIEDFSDDSWKRKKVTKMEIYFVNIIKKDSFNFYLEIPEFKEGIYFIDVSKKNKIKIVNCYMCKDSINAIDITPHKWEKRKKWRN